ncbi:Myb-like DNA-binding domain protein [Physocladia obscura]|uniref:Myb-like DNA-binding domain protein n=1 Tax=Physocladia obscura TaxID=109957 RepID=A0AAD5T964_9FUNG|nr:Myb-like DNA-binding domain protein [Physocladia obscura]
MDAQHFYSHNGANYFSPDGSTDTSPSPSTFTEFSFMNHYQLPHQSNTNNQSLNYLAHLAALPQEYLFSGIYSSLSPSQEHFFSGAEYLEDANNHAQVEQQQHTSSICMAPSSIFNSNFIMTSTTPPSSFVDSPTSPTKADSRLTATISNSKPHFQSRCVVSSSPSTQESILASHVNLPSHQIELDSSVLSQEEQEQEQEQEQKQELEEQEQDVDYGDYKKPKPIEKFSKHHSARSTPTRRMPYPPQLPISRPVRNAAVTARQHVTEPVSSSESPSPSLKVGRSFSSASSSASTTVAEGTKVDENVIYNKWTPEEDEILQAAIARVTKNNTAEVAGKWVRIAQLVPNRTPIQCSARWSGALNNDIVRGKWTPREDKLLVSAVEDEVSRLGKIVTGESMTCSVDPSDLNWQKISLFVPGRTGVQCAARYQEALDPDIRKGKWLEEEDVLLKQGLMQHGKSWVKIAANIPNRTQRQCRTRWLQIYPKMTPEAKEEMERLCGGPIAVNEKIKRKKNANVGGSSSTGRR